MPPTATDNPAASTLTHRGRLGQLAPARPIEVLSPGLVRTPRLVLRPWREGDRAAFIRAVSSCREYLDQFCPLHRPGESDMALFDRQLALCAEGDRRGLAWRRAAFLDDGRLVGGFNLNNITRGLTFTADMSWWVTQSLSGRGLGTEGAGALVDTALAEAPRGLGLLRVEALIAPENKASLAVARRVGLCATDGAPVLIERGGVVTPHHVFTAQVPVPAPGPVPGPGPSRAGA